MVKGLSAWKELVKFVWNIFSIEPLFKTLFVPFHQEGFSRGEWWERVIFNLIMRGVGALARLFIIFFGFIFLIIAILTFPFFLLFQPSVNPDNLKKHRAFGRDLSFRWTPRLNRSAREIPIVRNLSLIGKEDAVARLENIIAGDNENNVLIVGAPGVGRKTLVLELARRIAWGRVLPELQYKHIFEISLENLSKDDVRALFSEAANAKNIILVIDNIHSYTEVFPSIIPFTDLPQLPIIAITDTDHYHSVLKVHGDFLKSFETIELKEPSDDEVAALVAGALEAKKITFDPDVPKEIVKQTNHLVMHVPQPEKSMDVVEELVAKQPKHLAVQDVHDLMSVKTGVPVGKISDEERNVLLNLEPTLREAIIGQEEVIKGIADTLRRGRSGVASESRPIGSFLFLGPTGVGKTHTAKCLAKLYYGSEEKMVAFDMTEFSQESSLDEFTKRLVVAIEENPFTLVLFDEIEKAHKAIHNLFLQILDEARITDSEGREAKLYNTFIICTSNALSDELVKNPKIEKAKFISDMLENKIFSPELLNRFDGVCLYRPLSQDDASQIANLLLKDFVRKMKEEKHLEISYGADLPVALALKAANSPFGAREIRREIEQTVQNYVADQIIKGTPNESISIPKDIIV
jgi:ATP-dependent Clp protease ATP-binding subunit ClpC